MQRRSWTQAFMHARQGLYVPTNWATSLSFFSSFSWLLLYMSLSNLTSVHCLTICNPRMLTPFWDRMANIGTTWSLFVWNRVSLHSPCCTGTQLCRPGWLLPLKYRLPHLAILLSLFKKKKSKGKVNLIYIYLASKESWCILTAVFRALNWL